MYGGVDGSHSPVAEIVAMEMLSLQAQQMRTASSDALPSSDRTSRQNEGLGIGVKREEQESSPFLVRS